ARPAADRRRRRAFPALDRRGGLGPRDGCLPRHGGRQGGGFVTRRALAPREARETAVEERRKAAGVTFESFRPGRRSPRARGAVLDLAVSGPPATTTSPHPRALDCPDHRGALLPVSVASRIAPEGKRSETATAA